MAARWQQETGKARRPPHPAAAAGIVLLFLENNNNNAFKNETQQREEMSSNTLGMDMFFSIKGKTDEGKQHCATRHQEIQSSWLEVVFHSPI